MAQRYYSNTAPPTTLSGGVDAIQTTITIASAAGLPPFQPYTLAIDPDTATMELVQVNSASGTTLTVTRAIDGTSASTHGGGAVVQHVTSARDFAESRAHENASNGVHGVTGSVVGTTDTQTLTNKTLTSPTVNTPSITGGTATNLSRSGGSMSGTVSGSPTFSGNPTFSGSPVFNGAVDMNGHLTADGGVTTTLLEANQADISGDVNTGTLIVNGDLIWNGDDGWLTYTPSWTATTTNPSLGLGVIRGRYRKVGRTIHLQISVSFGTNTTFGSGEWMFQAPYVSASIGPTAEFMWMGSAIGFDRGTAWYPGVCRIQGGTDQVRILSPQSVGSTGGTGGEWNATRPTTWANTDVLNMSITYEAFA